MPDTFQCPSEVFNLRSADVARLDAAHEAGLLSGRRLGPHRTAFEMGWISAFEYILTQGVIRDGGE
jgi:hypothetical protein